MRVVITPNPYRDKNLKCAVEAKEILEKVGIEASICLAFEVDKDFLLPRDVHLGELARELLRSDLLICFGGDGTLLHASKAATYHGLPVLGVNIGTMGFMAELEYAELSELRRLAEQDYTLEDRMMLSVSVLRDGNEVMHDEALNDAVITKGAVARVIQLCVFCDGTEAMSYGGDGVIVCTPTGSTAYSMSAGGPILEPVTDNIVITPVCAHTLQARPVVTGGNRVIEVRIGRIGRKNAFLSVDGGRAFRLNTGDTVRIQKSVYKTRLVRLREKSFFEIISKKFK
ncbi:MAG: NAD(+)/NADH kinase [Oscillospiraceae bacterium]|nr:NAD(+)/NADH kinase [Oscillospiraceae bacterium]